MGSGIAGLSTWEREYRMLQNRGPGRVSPFLITMMVPNMVAGQLAIMLGATGPSQCPVLACATGAEAIAEGLELIRRGDADVVIAGSAEAPITPPVYGGFCVIRAVSRRNDEPHRASRPFDQDRDGFVMSEGAGPSSSRARSTPSGGAPSHSRRRATAARRTPTTLPPQTRRAAGWSGRCNWARRRWPDRGRRRARERSRHRDPDGRRARDEGDLRVMPHALVSGTKSMTGHSFGAVGATEGIMCALALKNEVVPRLSTWRTWPRTVRPGLRGGGAPGCARPQGGHLQLDGLRWAQRRGGFLEGVE